MLQLKPFLFVQLLCSVLGEVSALASVSVLLQLGAISWSLLTAEDQVYSNLNSRSCEDEVREILELSKLLVWFWRLAAILFAALLLIVTTCIWSPVACSSCSCSCRRQNLPAGKQVWGRASSGCTCCFESRRRSRNSPRQPCRV